MKYPIATLAASLAFLCLGILIGDRVGRTSTQTDREPTAGGWVTAYFRDEDEDVVGPDAAKIVHILEDDSRDWSGTSDVYLSEGTGNERHTVMEVCRCKFETVHGSKLKVIVWRGKNLSDPITLEPSFTREGVRAVESALDRRAAKTKAVWDTKMAAERRKAIDGLK